MDATAKSSKSARLSKPQKPYEGFPLTPHPTGRWCKKIRGKLHYFSRIEDDPEGDAALQRFNREWPCLKEGRIPLPLSTDADALTVGDLSNLVLDGKRMKLESGELSRTSFAAYYRTCGLLVKHFGTDRRGDDIRPDGFSRLRNSMAKKWSPTTLRNEINRVRVVFKFAFDERLIDRPVHYGQSFNRPSAKQLRRVRNEAGPPMPASAASAEVQLHPPAFQQHPQRRGDWKASVAHQA